MKLNWKPSELIPTDLNVKTPEAVVAALAEVGYQMPCTLGDDDLPILRGMAATAPDAAPYKSIINLITMHDVIDLWTED